MERLVKFEVLGQEYPLYTDAPADEVEEILQLVREQIEDHTKLSANILPANKIAVLASLNMAGKYVSLKREFEQYKESIGEYAERLMQKIEQNALQAKNQEMNSGEDSTP